MRARVGTVTIFCVLTAAFVLDRVSGAVGNDARPFRLGALSDGGELGGRTPPRSAQL